MKNLILFSLVKISEPGIMQSALVSFFGALLWFRSLHILLRSNFDAAKLLCHCQSLRIAACRSELLRLCVDYTIAYAKRNILKTHDEARHSSNTICKCIIFAERGLVQ